MIKNNIEKNEELKRASTIEELGAWLIYNELYLSQNHIKLAPNPTDIRSNDIRSLFQAMYDFFAGEIKKEIANEALCSKSEITSMFISINFTLPETQKWEQSGVLYIEIAGEKCFVITLEILLNR